MQGDGRPHARDSRRAHRKRKVRRETGRPFYNVLHPPAGLGGLSSNVRDGAFAQVGWRPPLSALPLPLPLLSSLAGLAWAALSRAGASVEELSFLPLSQATPAPSYGSRCAEQPDWQRCASRRPPVDTALC
eukprot:scaffold88074_cov31-Tisochrysis_lutea.AAC.3